MSFVIEKGVPPPARGKTAPNGLRAAILSMEVGDSFFYASTSRQPCQNLYQVTKPLKERKYTCRTVEGGARLWRLA